MDSIKIRIPLTVSQRQQAIPLGVQAGGGGTGNYNALTNKPAINGHELVGDQTAAELGLIRPEDVPTKTSDLTNDSGFVNAAGAAAAAPVQSVNGKTGAVTLDAEDVGALPDSSTLDNIPDGLTYKRPTAAQVQQISANEAAIALKQPTITASGLLKGNGAGGVSAATPGTDYQAPLVAGTDYETPAGAKALGLTGASVGDLVRVNAVDANGKPTSWAKMTQNEITNLSAKADELAIVVNGNTSALGADNGQYVILRNSTISGKADGLYTASKTIPANTAIDATYLGAQLTIGGLNAMQTVETTPVTYLSGDAAYDISFIVQKVGRICLYSATVQHLPLLTANTWTTFATFDVSFLPGTVSTLGKFDGSIVELRIITGNNLANVQARVTPSFVGTGTLRYSFVWIL